MWDLTKITVTRWYKQFNEGERTIKGLRWWAGETSENVWKEEKLKLSLLKRCISLVERYFEVNLPVSLSPSFN